MKKILIIEDEYELAENIKELLEEEDYEIVAIHKSSEEALETVRSKEVDLIILDIMLQGTIDGIELAKMIKEIKNIPIIFCTAFSSREVLERISKEVYEGYLLKPFSPESLKSSVYLGLKKSDSKEEESDFLKIIDKGSIVPLDPSDIVFIQAYGIYSKVITSEKTYVVRDILKVVESKLPKNNFLRIHRSYIINLKRIGSFNSKKINMENYSIPIKRGMYPILKKLLNID